MSLPSYIKDTKDFIEHMNICENVKLPDHPILLVTMDVESLYTNVPFQGGLDAITFFLDQRPCQVPGTACMTSAKLVLSNEYVFVFGFLH